MGYRSEVDVVIYAPVDSSTPYGLLKLWFDENYPHAVATNEWEARITYDPESRGISVYYNDVKWYESYEHPQQVEKVFEAIDRLLDTQPVTSIKDGVSQDPNVIPFEIAWEFVRLGEEDQDTEIRMSANADAVIGVNRSTEISFQSQA
jgi:hypothetical protein